jgi:predicted acyltransferase
MPLPRIDVDDVPLAPPPPPSPPSPRETPSQGPAVPPAPMESTRLMSLDAFRGLVILAMLIVNNLGDSETTGYFWKHAEWPAMSQGQAWRGWWGYSTHSPAWRTRLAQLPLERYRLESQLGIKRVQLRVTTRSSDQSQAAKLAFEADQLERQLAALDEEQQLAAGPWRRIPIFTFCTLADYVMPAFMLIIGVAMPFSIAAARRRGTPASRQWLRTFRRVFLLVLLGWILVFFRDDFAPAMHGEQPWTFRLGMDVLQLLGLGYLVARIGYALPIPLRAAAIALLMIWHWALLRFAPQGPAVPAGTFSSHFEAIGYLYARFPTLHLGPRVAVVLNGLLSIPPAAATMLIGTIVGDWLGRWDREPRAKVERLALWGVGLALLGFLWAFDLPFNKPRWTPAYLLYVSGVGAVVLAMLYAIVDVNRLRAWAHFAVVFGANAIAVYWLSIMAKILLLNTPRVAADNARTLTLIRYATLGVVTLTLGTLIVRFAGWVSRYLGPAASAIPALALLPLSVMWVLMLRHPLAPVPADTGPAVQSIGAAVLSSLKFALGPWAGGWTFTTTFVAFWWLVLDRMHARRIFWKL